MTKEKIIMGELVDKYVLVAGSANAPKDTGVHNVFNVISVSMLIDRKTHCIHKARLNVPSELTREYFSDLVEGFCVLDSAERLCYLIRKNIMTSSSNAIIQALKMAILRYRDRIEENNL